MRKTLHVIAVLIIIALVPFFLGMISAHAATVPASNPPQANTQHPVKMLVRTAWPLKAKDDTDIVMELWTDEGPVTTEQLLPLRGAKIHLFLLSPDFREFYHAMPVPTSQPGQYRTTIHASRVTTLRAYAYFLTKDSAKISIADVNNARQTIVPLMGKQIPLIERGDYRFTIDFAHTLHAGEANTGVVQAINFKNYTPIKNLMPVPDYFAFVTAFAPDYSTVLPAAPVGPVPAPDAKGGPEVQFNLTPPMEGLMPIFAQVKVGEENFTLPFIVSIAPASPTVKSRDLENPARPEYQDDPGK